MKARRRPKWSLLFSNLKTGVVGITYTDRTRNKRESKLTLVTGFVPNNLQLKQAPNDPTNVEQMTAFDLDIRQWVTFDLESIEEYKGLITAPRMENEQRRKEVSGGEESRNERPEETSNARKFRSRYEPET